MAAGEVRGSFSMSEPDLGSDVAAIKTRAVRDDGDDYVVNGAKMWLTNGGSSNLIALLARTDEGAAKPHQNLTAFLVEKPAGFGEVAAGPDHPRQDRQDGLQGRRHHRGAVRRLPRSPPTASSAASPAAVSPR